MRDTTNTAEKLRAAGFNDRQVRVIARAQTESPEVGGGAESVMERLRIRLDKMERLLMFAAYGVAAILMKGLPG